MAIVTKRAEERVTFTRSMRVKVALFLSFKNTFCELDGMWEAFLNII